MSIDIRIASENITSVEDDEVEETEFTRNHFFSPGDIITSDAGFMRGHGTYMKNGALHASVAGAVHRVNKLISVTPLKTKYQGEIGDVVVGRITEVQQKRWKIDVNGRLDAILQLSSVNLPGGELRRRSAEDELAMRKYLKEGDLVSAEVQNVHNDGGLSLHTRSLKYGKLSQGTLLQVSPSLIKRRKTHFHRLPCGAHVILGNNGYIWISPGSVSEEGTFGGFAQNLSVVPKDERIVVARLRNTVLALASRGIALWDTSLSYGYDASDGYQPEELLKEEVVNEVAQVTKQKLEFVTLEN